AAFLEMTTGAAVREAFARFVHPTLKHHVPQVSGDADSLVQSMETMARNRPNRTLLIKHLVEEGDLVFVHSHLRVDPRDERGLLKGHIFRFEGDRVAELWDFGEPVPEPQLNVNGAF